MSPRLDDLHKSFSRHLRAEGCADRTLVIYGQSIKFFSRWLSAQGRQGTGDELTDHIRPEDWREERHGECHEEQPEVSHGE